MKTPGVPSGAQPDGVDYTDVPNTQSRKNLAKLFVASMQTIPQFHLSVDTCVDKLLKLQSDLNSTVEASRKHDAHTENIAFNDIVMKATAMALKEVPELNSSWTDDYIRQYHNVNVMLAVQTEYGNMAFVLKDADKKDLATISDEIKALTGKAKSNTLQHEDSEGGTFTVVDLGVKQFSAIILPPQGCILAVGTTEERLIPGGERAQYEIGTFMTVTLGCDHRVVDGGVGAKWLNVFKGYIEDPSKLLI